MFLSNPRTGQMKATKRGFSWTSFFFGPWPALFRGDWKFAILGFVIGIAGWFTAGIGNIVYGFVVGFKYNEWYVNGLLEKGWVEITGADFYGARQAIAPAMVVPVPAPVPALPVDPRVG